MSTSANTTLTHGNISNRSSFEINRSRLPQGSFGWLYRHLPEWRPKLDARAEIAALAETMRAGQRREGNLPAGYTYFAQLIDHDLTFDPSSLSQQIDDPEALHHFRTPAFDLDCIYGRGPRIDCILYSDVEPERLDVRRLPLTGELDLPRIDDRAIIADNRNDDFIILSQMHVGLMNFHNFIVDRLLEHPSIRQLERGRQRSELVFHTARKLVRWHYQWVILFDFLPKILHPTVWERLAARIRACATTRDRTQLIHYRPETSPFLPIEFTAAAFRFAHSLPRSSYKLNDLLARDLVESLVDFRGAKPNMSVVQKLAGKRSGDLVRLGFICDQLELGSLPTFTSTRAIDFQGRKIRMLGSIHPDLRGRRPLPANWGVDWNIFFDRPDGKGQRAMAIGPSFSSPMFEIPIGPDGQSLASLDLLKGFAQRLPSGQTLARRMGISRQNIVPESAFPSGVDQHLRRETPLLYYILAEAAFQSDGNSLGSLGSEIVGEVLVGLMLEDATSYLNEVVHWQPNYDRSYTLHDLLSCRFDPHALDGLYLGL